MALHQDQEAMRTKIAEHEFELNGVFQTTRILIEFAVAECPITRGHKPGRLDMSRFMAMVAEITGLGGWSDAIRWNMMEPKLRVTPLGDIHANATFHEEIVAPYGRMGIDLTINESIKNYAENLDEPSTQETDRSKFDSAFLAALEDQFGTTIEIIRVFVDAVENLGIEKNRAVFLMRRDDFLAALAEKIGHVVGSVKPIFDFLLLRPRPEWRTPQAGFLPRDIFPWRFRRQLSVLRKPLIQIDDEEDGRIAVTPGLLRDALTYMMHHYHRGDFPLWQLKSLMKSWAGESRKRMGREFAEKAAARLNELGWTTDTDIKVTALLGKSFGRDYGDVDVCAYNAVSKRVLLIECKDVQHRKTPGEIAEQLSDFQGENIDGKPDLLLRHLMRVDLIKEHTAEVARHVGSMRCVSKATLFSRTQCQ